MYHTKETPKCNNNAEYKAGAHAHEQEQSRYTSEMRKKNLEQKKCFAAYGKCVSYKLISINRRRMNE